MEAGSPFLVERQSLQAGESSVWGGEGKLVSLLALLHIKRCILCFCGLGQLIRAGAPRPEATASLLVGRVYGGPSCRRVCHKASAAVHKLTESV